MPSPSKDVFAGFAWAAAAILIWSGSLVMLRLGMSTSLNANDLTFLRFGVSAVILAPVILRRGTGSSSLGAAAVVAMVIAFGAPYVLLLASSFHWVPAAAAGALNPGVMAIAAVCLGRVLLGWKIALPRLAGIVTTAFGIGLFTWTEGDLGPGHMILIGTGIMWAVYTLIVRRNAVPALNAAAIVSVGSALIYAPVYWAVLPKQILTASWADILQQGIFQGILAGVVAIYAFNRSGELLGPVAGATLPALIPVVTMGLGGLFLGEPAGPAEFIAASVISVGVVLILVGDALTGRVRFLLGQVGRRAS